MPTPQLLLLPGLLCDRRLWQSQIAALADSAHITVADLTGADSMPALAAAALAQIPAGDFALAGLSMGGYVALEIMRQAPGRVQALALLDTNARADSEEAKGNRRKLVTLATANFPAVIDTLLPKLLHPSHLQDPVLVNLVRAMATDIGSEAFGRQQQAIMDRTDSRPLLAGIGCPTLILCGRNDTLTPVEVHEEMAAGIPGASLRILDHCGHLSTLEQPQQVAQALGDWLRRIP